MATNINVLTKLNLTDKGMTIRSTDLVDIINQFREEEKKELGADKKHSKPLMHKNLIAKIRTELEILEKLKLRGKLNFKPTYYLDKQGKERECYQLTRDGMLQMLNSESALVRYKTIEYINKLEQENEQLESDYNEMGQVALSDEDLEARQYEHDRIHYSINNIEKRLLECNYTNVVSTVNKIINVHTNLYVKDRYKPHQDTDKYGFRGDNLYVNHVKGLIESKLDKIRPQMVLKDADINSIILTKARQLHKEIEASKNISSGREISKLKKDKCEIKANAVELIKELSDEVIQEIVKQNELRRDYYTY